MPGAPMGGAAFPSRRGNGWPMMLAGAPGAENDGQIQEA